MIFLTAKSGWLWNRCAEIMRLRSGQTMTISTARDMYSGPLP
jgi:hypothetical protein